MTGTGAAARAATLEIGRIAKPHGVAGAVKVALNWAASDALSQVDELTLELAGGVTRQLRIEWLRPMPKQVLLKLEGIDSMNAAEPLRGAKVLVERARLPELEEGEYYLVDLLGARAVGPDGPIGEVVEVRVHPSVDSVVLRRLDGKLCEQPLREPWVVRVDTREGVLELSGTDGLIE